MLVKYDQERRKRHPDEEQREPLKAGSVRDQETGSESYGLIATSNIRWTFKAFPQQGQVNGERSQTIVSGTAPLQFGRRVVS